MLKKKELIVLGIETSCDDTAIGLLKYSGNSISILSNLRQTHLSKEYLGIVPEVVARNHLKYIKLILNNVLNEANLKLDDVDIICSTVGPGLIGSLIVGYNFGAALAYKNNKIFVPIHHIEGHISAAHIGQNIQYPYLVVIISGGHTLIIKVDKFFNYEIISKSIDDSIGEFLDKIGRKLGLPYPAGPEIETLAQNYDDKNKNYKKFPIIQIPIKDRLDFSFSGLKTKFLKLCDEYPIEQVCYEIQKICAKTLKFKLEEAIKITKFNTVIISGGVASNKYIRSYIDTLKMKGIEIFYPPISLCVDNGAMIGAAGIFHYINKTKVLNNLKIEEFSRMSLEEWSKIS